MKKAILIFTIATILTATDSWAYSNECVKSGSGSSYNVDCYDDNGYKTSMKSYDGDPDNGGSVSSAQTYTYDSNGNRTSEKIYIGDPDKGASVNNAYTYTYDSNGNQTSKKTYTGDPDNGGSVYNAYTYTYDSNGNWISYKKYTFNSDGSGTIKNYTCNGSCTFVSTETFTAEQGASILAGFPTNYFPPANSNPQKRTYYTLAEAAAHVNHSNHNRVIFTFK